LGDTWRNHNRVFDESAANGNLVWRVKTYNHHSNSIDYVEVWRSAELLHTIFNNAAPLSEDQEWTPQQKRELGRGIWESGFDARHFRPFPGISRKLALEYYQHFLQRRDKRDNCIINTPYNPQLNPL
jgi:hypothetical protein